MVVLERERNVNTMIRNTKKSKQSREFGGHGGETANEKGGKEYLGGGNRFGQTKLHTAKTEKSYMVSR